MSNVCFIFAVSSIDSIQYSPDYHLTGKEIGSKRFCKSKSEIMTKHRADV